MWDDFLQAYMNQIGDSFGALASPPIVSPPPMNRLGPVSVRRQKIQPDQISARQNKKDSLSQHEEAVTGVVNPDNEIKPYRDQR
jgi:hypothetical protein